jgi:hypothetical protein
MKKEKKKRKNNIAMLGIKELREFTATQIARCIMKPIEKPKRREGGNCWICDYRPEIPECRREVYKNGDCKYDPTK